MLCFVPRGACLFFGYDTICVLFYVVLFYFHNAFASAAHEADHTIIIIVVCCSSLVRIRSWIWPMLLTALLLIRS